MNQEAQQTPPTNEQILMQVVQTFLQRTDLKGGEVDSYAKAFNFVQAIVEGQLLVIPAAVWQETKQKADELEARDAQAVLDADEGEDLPVLEEDPVEELDPVE